MSTGIGGGMGLGINEEIFAYHDGSDMGQEITVRITMQERDPTTRAVNERTKSIKFISSAFGVDCVSKIIDTFNVNPDPEAGLWFKSVDLTKCYWLDLTKTLRYYDIHNMDELIYKKVKEPLRIRLMDGSRKVIMCDTSLKVSDITEIICVKQGISNPEEFSLMVAEDELTDEQRANREKMLKRRRKRGEPISDDDWLRAEMTLNAQGVSTDTTLLLKKKFFFFDANIDTSDPQTLSLLFEQLREDVVSGALPVQFDETVLFAALMCQVVLGPHDPDKHKKKTIDIKAMVPIEFKKTKKLHEKVFRAHAQLATMNKDDAKFRFIQLARSLDTFGITVFHVQEPIRDKKGKLTKKFQPCLLGISKSHLFRLDPITKVPRETPFLLTQLRRWSPSKTSITLDYGDHKDEYYTVLTEEGQKISALIAGYIDIILNQRRDRAKELEDDEQRAIEEELIAPSRAMGGARLSNRRRQMTTTQVSHPGHHRAPRPSDSLNASNSAHRRLSVSNIADLDAEIKRCATVLAANTGSGKNAEHDPALDDMPDELKHTNLQNARDMLADILGDLSAESGAALEAVYGAGPGGKDGAKIDLTAASQRLLQLNDELGDAVRNASRLMEATGEDDDDLIKASNDVSAKISSMLNLALSDIGAVDGANLGDLLAAAQDLGLAFNDMLDAGGVPDARPLSLDDLLSAAGAVSQAVAAMSEPCGGVAGSDAASEEDKAKLADAQAKLAGSAAATHASIAAAGATVLDAQTQGKLKDKAAAMKGDLNALLSLADIDGLDPVLLGDLKAAADSVADAIRNLSASLDGVNDKIDRTSDIAASAAELDSAVVVIVNAASAKQALAGSKDALAAAVALADLADAEADAEVHQGFEDDLTAANAELRAAIDALNAATRNVKKAPNNKAANAKLRDAAMTAGEAGAAIHTQRARKRTLFNLARAAKSSSSATATLIDVVDAAGENSNPSAESRARRDADKAQPSNAGLDAAALAFSIDPHSLDAQKDLLAATKKAVPAASRVVIASKGAAASYEDPTDEDSVSTAARNAGQAHAALTAAYKAARDACWDLEVDAALAKIREEDAAVAAAAGHAADGSLEPESEFITAESSGSELQYATQALAEAGDTLVNAHANLAPEDVGNAAKSAAANTSMFAGASINLAAVSDDSNTAANLESARGVIAAMAALVAAVRKSNSDPAAVASAKAANARLKSELDTVTESLPGVGDALRAERTIDARVSQLDLASLPDTSGDVSALNDDVLAAARALAAALGKLPSAVLTDSAADMAAASNKIASAYDTLQDAVEAAAGAMDQAASKAAVIGATVAIAGAAKELLSTARDAATDADDTDAPAKLAAKNEAGSEAVAQLVASLESAASSTHSEFDAVVASILESVAQFLDDDAEPPSSLPSSLDAAISAALALSADVAGKAKALAKTAKASNADADALAAAAQAFGEAVTGLSSATGAVNALSSGGSGAGASDAAGPSFPSKPYKKNAETVESGVKALGKLKKPKGMLKAAAATAKASMALEKSGRKAAKALLADHGKSLPKPALKAAKKLMAALDGLKTANKKLGGAASSGVTSAEEAAALVKASKGVRSAERAFMDAAAGLDAALPRASGGSDGDASAAAAEMVVHATRVADAAAQEVSAAKVVAQGGSASSKTLVASASKAVVGAVGKFDGVARSAAPGARETQDAIARVADVSEDLEETAMAASIGELETSSKLSLESAASALVSTTNDIELKAAQLKAAVNDGEDGASLGARAAKLAELVEDVGVKAKAAAAKTSDGESQGAILASAQALASDVLALLAEAAKGSDDASPKAVKASVASIEEDGGALRAALGEASAALGAMDGLTSAAAAVRAVTERTVGAQLAGGDAPPRDKSMGYADYQREIKSDGKKLASGVLHLGKAGKKGQAKKLTAVGTQIAGLFPSLMAAVAAAAPMSSKRDKLLESAAALGALVADALDTGAAIVDGTAADDAGPKLSKTCSSKIAKGVSVLIAVAKAEASADRAAEDAVIAIEDALGDLDTLTFMATSGQLKSSAGASYADHQGDVEAAAGKVGKAMTKMTKAAGEGSPDATGAAAGKLAANVAGLFDVLELALPTLPDLGAQQSLLDAARALVEALAGLTGDAVEAAANPDDGDASAAVAAGTKATTKTLKTLLKTNAKVEEMATSGRKALKSAIAVIEQALDSLNPEEAIAAGTKATTTPDQVSDESQTIAKASTKLMMAAKKSQDKMGAVASDMARGIVGFLMTCKNAAPEATPEARAAFYGSVKSGCGHVVTMMNVLKAAGADLKKNRPAQKKLRSASAKVADGIAEIAASAEFLVGDGEMDETAAALKESAKAIESSSAKLKKMRPKRGESPDMLSFEESVVEACKTIMQAAAALVKRSVVVQKEVAGSGAGPSDGYIEGDFESGLISASQRVQAECRQLVDVAGEILAGQHNDPYLVIKAACKGVATSTVHLVTAGQVKAGSSKPQEAMKAAGKNVKTAAKALMEIADQNRRSKRAAAGESNSDDDDIALAEGQVGGNRQDMEAQLAILQAQAELEKARRRKEKINRARAKKKRAKEAAARKK